MSTVTAIDELLRRNAELDRSPRASDAAPARQVCVLTCMDARINIPETFGIADGEAHILRNGGGIVTDDVIRSIALSQRHLGTTEVLIMGHTSCGLSTITEDGFKDELETATGLRPTFSIEAFNDVTASVRQSVARARRSPFLLHTDGVRGFVYDIGTGRVSEVE